MKKFYNLGPEYDIVLFPHGPKYRHFEDIGTEVHIFDIALFTGLIPVYVCLCDVSLPFGAIGWSVIGISWSLHYFYADMYRALNPSQDEKV